MGAKSEGRHRIKKKQHKLWIGEKKTGKKKLGALTRGHPGSLLNAKKPPCHEVV